MMKRIHRYSNIMTFYFLSSLSSNLGATASGCEASPGGFMTSDGAGDEGRGSAHIRSCGEQPSQAPRSEMRPEAMAVSVL